MLAVFEATASAVRCAVELQEVAGRQGIAIRAGVHTGDTATGLEAAPCVDQASARLAVELGTSTAKRSSSSLGLAKIRSVDRGVPMTTYLMRFSYKPETWKRLRQDPEDRRDAARAYAEQVARFSASGMDSESTTGTRSSRRLTTRPWLASRLPSRRARSRLG